MPNTGGIFFVDQLPVSAVDGTGINLTIASGTFARRERWDRSMWRRHLETELRKLDEYELAERADRGRVIPMQRECG